MDKLTSNTEWTRKEKPWMCGVWSITNRLYSDAGGRRSGDSGGCRRRVGRDGDGRRWLVAGTGAARSAAMLGGPRCAPRQHVDDGVLDERREDEHETDDHPDVDRLDVGDARQWRPRTATHRRRRQHSQQPDGDACRAGVDIDPERHQRQNDDEDRWDVDLNEEVTEVTTQNKLYLETRVRTCHACAHRNYHHLEYEMNG